MSLIEPFLWLFLAHLIGDFVLQTEQMALKKGHMLPWLALHATIVAAITWGLCWTWDAWIVVIAVFISHLLFDAIKPHLPGSQLVWYILDQSAHLVVLLLGAYVMVHYYNLEHMPLSEHFSLKVLALICGYLVVGRPLTIGIGLFLKPWKDELIGQNGVDCPVTGLARSSEWIGNLERFFTMTCVLIDQYFLVAALLIAKAIMRFGETLRPEHRKRADYIVLGTLASIGAAVFVAVLTRLLLGELQS